MEPFRSLTSPVIRLPEANVDTDQIIPAPHVNARGRDRLRAALFAERRARDGDFPFNAAAAQGRRIMQVGPNFGCGSSREAAAWALAAWDIRAVIGTSFNDTFANNCFQNGILVVPLSGDDWQAADAMLGADPDSEITVDLEAEAVSLGEVYLGFSIPPFRRRMLLEGQDELDYLLARKAVIARFVQGAGKSGDVLCRDAR